MEEFPKPEQSIEEKFAESKVRNADGTLMKVYHYSDDEIERFSSGFAGKNYSGDKGFFGSGIYFTDSSETFVYGSKQYAAFLNLKNPLVIRNPTAEDVQRMHGEREELQSQGYDGVMVWNDAKPDETKRVFGSEQVIKGRAAGWSEICVFDPEDIHMLGARQEEQS